MRFDNLRLLGVLFLRAGGGFSARPAPVHVMMKLVCKSSSAIFCRQVGKVNYACAFIGKLDDDVTICRTTNTISCKRILGGPASVLALVPVLIVPALPGRRMAELKKNETKPRAGEIKEERLNAARY